MRAKADKHTSKQTDKQVECENLINKMNKMEKEREREREEWKRDWTPDALKVALVRRGSWVEGSWRPNSRRWAEHRNTEELSRVYERRKRGWARHYKSGWETGNLLSVAETDGDKCTKERGGGRGIHYVEFCRKGHEEEGKLGNARRPQAEMLVLKSFYFHPKCMS